MNTSKRALSVNATRKPSTARRSICWLPVGVLVASLLAPLTGCGTNVEALLLQSVTALGQTYVDQLLTDLANDLAERREEAAAEPEDSGTGGSTGGEATGGSGGSGSLDELTGDPAAGEALFAVCGGCHCTDASGGCFPGAPSLVGVDAATIDEMLRGVTSHPVKQDATDQDIADLAAYLASLGG